MTRVEEARRPALRRRTAREVRLGGLHLVPRVGERGSHARDVLGRSGPVEGVVRPLVCLHRAEVCGLRLGDGLDLLVQPDDVVGEPDEIFPRERLDVRKLALALAPAAERAETQQCRDSPARDQEPGREAAAILRGGRLGRFRPASPTRRTKSVRTAATPSSLGLERTGREVGCLIPPRSVLTARNWIAHDNRVHPRMADAASELERDVRARAAGLGANRRRRTAMASGPAPLLWISALSRSASASVSASVPGWT